ncbi:Signal transduction histidine kinase CheA [hydrothermal vent metagenome]|uniref:histidine kinase n=1 Tax=hydrothermal vent metagenome TaxID=652676 RepID=A0A3B0X077_9ZZZZ
MKTEDTVEYNSLRWVKKELDLILVEAQTSLSAYIEDTDDTSRLQDSIEHLHMVQGTLQMVELYGAAHLAEEMEKVSSALAKGTIDKVDDAYDVLMRSMLQLPDYLESLQSGRKDVPMILLPLLNDLRASRNASLLSENVLFFPDVEVEDSETEVPVESGALIDSAKKLRPHLQIGLVGWFKQENVSASLKRIIAVFGELEKSSSTASVRRIWSISSALIEGLSLNGIDTNLSIKMLLGQVDRTIKQLIDSDEDTFSENVPTDLLKNLLFYVARISTDSPRVKDIKTTYRLDELLPNDTDLEEARSGMGGLNIELLTTVSAGIREDLLEVKDSLEIFVHSEIKNLSRLSSLPDLLTKIGDTLSMLGLGLPREQVIAQQDVVNQMITGDIEPTDEIIMDVAGELLAVESQLNSFIAQRSSSNDDETAHRVGDLAEMPEGEYLEVLSAVIREALLDFNEAKLAILSYLNDPVDKSLLELVLQRLDEVSGAMFMLPIQKLKHQISSVHDYVLNLMLRGNQIPEASVQNDLADVITSIEYYLEAIVDGRPDIGYSMDSGNAAADRLASILANTNLDELASEIEKKDELVIEDATVLDMDKTSLNETDSSETGLDDDLIELEPDVTLDENVNDEAVVEEAEEVERYVILRDDSDEEILEIFIEEAQEELESLREQIPTWERDRGNEEALGTIRRSFHTLKGSGRLIGAELIGEFSWNFENLLNRVLDKSRPLNQDVFEILNEALDFLPKLIAQLEGNRDPIPKIYQLIDRSEAMGTWTKPKTKTPEKKYKKDGDTELDLGARNVSDTQLDEANEDPTTVLDSANPDDSDEDIIELDETEDKTTLDLNESLDETILDIDGQDASSSVDESFSIEILEDEVMDEILDDELLLDEGEPADDSSTVLMIDDVNDDTDEEFNIDLTDELEALHTASSDEDEASDASDNTVLDVLSVEDESDDEVVLDEISEEESHIHIDPVLCDIFKSETENHLLLINDLLDQHHQSVAPLTASDELLRALHTLFGSARTAEVDEIARLCGGLEKYVRLYLKGDELEISESGVTLVTEVVNKVRLMLNELENKTNALDVDEALIQRIADLSEEKQDEISREAENDADLTILDEVSINEPVVELTIEEPADEIAPTVLDDTALEEPDVELIEVEESSVVYADLDDELVDIFLEEADELLENCENSLQLWNENNNDEESVLDLQRHLHTLKGGARMADLGPVGDLTHALESLIIVVNDKTIPFTKPISHAFHDALDQLTDMLMKVKDRIPLAFDDSMTVYIDALREGKEPPNKAGSPIGDEGDDPEPVAAVERSSSEQDENNSVETSKENEPGESAGLLETTLEVENDHQLTDDSDIEVLSSDDTSAVETPAHESIQKTDEIPHSVINVLDIAEPEVPTIAENATSSKLILEKVDSQLGANDSKGSESQVVEQVRVRSDLLNQLVNHAGEVSVYHARMGRQISNFSFNLSEMNQTVIRLREQLRQLSIETEAQILSRYEKETDQYDADFDPLEMDRFSTMQQISRSLQETVGDIESIKDILYEEVRDSETLLSQESRVSTELQEGLMRTRMVQFGGLASRLRRIVRQTARELDKDVELEIIGETSEVDRTVLDRIVAPLEHMLRNAVSHGIETKENRIASEKSESGLLRVVVDREGADIVIVVSDDGRGLDADAIRKKAIEKGLIKEGSTLTDHDVLQFILEAGISTADSVTQISGRGVGMDVVDSEIKQLGGVLEINTVPGEGTTFKIRLPLTLAINHALLVNVGDDIYAVPLNSIEGVVRLSGVELQQFYDSEEETYGFAGSEYVLKHLGHMLTGEKMDYSRSGQLFPVLLARSGDLSIALHVDNLIGRREVVVKPVGAQISTVRGISGATILGDGRVVIILEMNALVLGDSLFHITEAEHEQESLVETPEVAHETIVMVVDDSITIRKVTERMLTRHDMKVITAKDGIDAVSQLQEVMPDVMLLDIEMPRMDGYEVATHVRNDPRLANLPIIMITSRSGSKHKDKAMQIGVNKYMGKPFQEDELLENIHELID